jgi:hypothetical protein
MYLRLGFLDHIVVSNAEMAMEVLKVHDADFASRPPTIADKCASFDWSNIGLASYGDQFCLLHKICATQLFTQARLNSFGPGRQEEMAYMVENIAKHSHGGKLVEIRPIFVLDSQILNYKILAKTNVLVNTWAISCDPKAWKNPLDMLATN